jgi:bacteriocin-like protein
MKNLKSKKFNNLSKEELNLVSGGGLIWPTSGTGAISSERQPATDGQTYTDMAKWETGWFSFEKKWVSGSAFQQDDNGKRVTNSGF